MPVMGTRRRFTPMLCVRCWIRGLQIASVARKSRLSGPGAGQVWHRVQELAGRARKRLPRGSANRRLDPFQGYKNAIDDQLQDATSVLDVFPGSS